MKPRGVLFKGEMVKAILNTKPYVWPPEPIDPKLPFKGVTQRTIDLAEMHEAGRALWAKTKKDEGRRWILNNQSERLLGLECDYGPAGRALYVKETFYRNSKDGFLCYAATPNVARDNKGKIVETADWANVVLPRIKNSKDWKCKPSIFMSRAESRIDLEVVSVSAERLHDITEEDAKLEGVTPYSKATAFIEIQPLDGMSDYKAGYRELWNKINGEGAWDLNLWVWRIAFRRTA